MMTPSQAREEKNKNCEQSKILSAVKFITRAQIEMRHFSLSCAFSWVWRLSSRCRIIFIESILKWANIKTHIHYTNEHRHTCTEHGGGSFQRHSLGVNFLIKCDACMISYGNTRHFSFGIFMKIASPFGCLCSFFLFFFRKHTLSLFAALFFGS